MANADPRLAAALADKYRIERELGAGGMATVYLAQDLKHDRKVALKVLRPELAAVIGAERFLAEIHTTAALQHSHILPLFDSGQADGFLFYVMPLVEGESLRDRLNREHQLPVDDAVRLTKEVLSALDYAHRHGVIHRDIKPENILLHDGQAQVADFGIALAVSQAGGNRMTETGLSLGTPGYMSPEQATGERTLDARSDVYSVACLLYEMLAGTPPHTGATVQAVIAAVVTKEPVRLSEQRKMVPPQVEAAVHKALAKLPADRFATAEAFSKALSEPMTAQAAALMTAGFAPVPARSRRLTTALGAAALLFALLAAWGWMRGGAHAMVNRFGLFLRSGESLSPVITNIAGGRIAISPDGRRFVYTGKADANTRLFVKNHDDVRPSPLAGTDGALSPFFSPDGRQIGFVLNGKSVRILPLDGGTAITLTDSANATAADWGDDGYVYFEVDSGVDRVRAGGGPSEHVYHMSQKAKEIGAEWPIVLPGATGLIFRLRHEGQGTAEFDIMAMPLPHGEAKVLTRGIYARYAVDGHLVVVTSEGKLLAIPFNAKSLTLTGPPLALYEGLENNPFAAAVALSRTGTLIYATAHESSVRDIASVTREGLAVPIDPAWQVQGTLQSFSLSPDGRSLAVELARGLKSDVWVKQLPAGPFSRITFGDSSYIRPRWTPNGKDIVFIGGSDAGGGAPFEKQADGVGAMRRLLTAPMNFGEVSAAPDGRSYLVRRVFTDAGNGDVFMFRGGDTTLVPLLVSPAREAQAVVSPDGKWLAYSSDESGVLEVYVRPFPAVASARWQISTAGGRDPQWAHSGRELFYRSGKDSLTAAEIRTAPAFNVGAQRALFSMTSYPIVGVVPVFAVTPDDRRFLMLRQVSASEPTELIVTENWFEELKARAQP